MWFPYENSKVTGTRVKVTLNSIQVNENKVETKNIFIHAVEIKLKIVSYNIYKMLKLS